MYNVIYDIEIIQRTNGRKDKLSFDFCQSYEWKSGWANMTDSGSVVLPSNLYYIDKFGEKKPLSGSATNQGGFTGTPFFMKGDKVILKSGYTYFNKLGVQIFEMNKIFEGYISNVNSGVPIELEVEDNMWLLKQTPLENKTFKSTDTLEDILQWIVQQANKVHGTNLVSNSLTKTNFGTLVVNNETASQLLNRLHKTYGFNSYFRDNELRCGSLIYVESEAQEQVFIMNGEDGNVLADGQELQYQRKDDIKISALAHNTIEEASGATTKDGHGKTKKVRLEVLVSIENNKRVDRVIAKGQSAPNNEDGERMQFFFPSAKNTKELADLAYDKLIQSYYTGLKGKFKSYGTPYIRHGDYAKIINPKLNEQDGKYKVKSVIYSGSESDGHRQEIEIDYKAI